MEQESYLRKMDPAHLYKLVLRWKVYWRGLLEVIALLTTIDVLALCVAFFYSHILVMIW